MYNGKKNYKQCALAYWCKHNQLELNLYTALTDNEKKKKLTFAKGTLPFNWVAAVSYSGASLWQWPHLRGKKT